MKILILKPSSLGDVIHALPVLRLLKLHFPRSEIYWWLEKNLKPLLEGDPDLAGIFSFERKRWATPRHLPELAQSIFALRQKHFDWVIDLQGLARSGMFAWLANGNLTVGLDNLREGAREGARGFYDLMAPRALAGTHAVDRYLAILPLLRVPVHQQFNWLPERREIAAKFNEKWKLNSAHWILLVPGARWNNKRWPSEYFSETVRQLLQNSPELNFAILGNHHDSELARVIAKNNPARCLDLTGQTSLPELIEWIRRCRLILTNDTGPMHIAAALGKPVVALFGPTDPKGTGPYQQKKNVIQLTNLPCVPCLKDYCTYAKPLECLRAINPVFVCEQVQKQLAK
ncbi:MAG: lipopolysaccharide heptosyltransferase II [Verrucomicrobiota bacterium]|nr:lipopolysaccharide heptosyltransferase II [Verrucomicrobiota bacterium]